MRILFWSDTLWPVIGGVEVLAANLVPSLQARGYELALITRSDVTDPPTPEYEEYLGMPVYRLPFQDAIDSRDAAQMMAMRRRVARLKQSFSHDLVHVFHPGLGQVFHLMTQPCPGPPSLVSLHQPFRKEQLTRETSRGQLLRRANWIVTCSQSVLAEMCCLMPEIAASTSVIPNSLPLPSLAPTPLPLGPPRLLCAGRVVPQKAFDVALRAFARLVGRYPEARLTIAGDGASRPELIRLADRLGISSVVDFPGWVAPPDTPGLMSRSTLIVMPSRREPFGLVALQAAQMARPIVATRVDGLLEVVIDQETGLLVEPENVEALAFAIAYLLDHPDVAARFGQAARRRVEHALGWEQYVDAYEAVYRRLVETGQRAAAH
jgi:glycogen(starch) synthase